MSAALTIGEQSLHFLDRPHQQLPGGAVTGEAAWSARDIGDPTHLFEPFTAKMRDSFEHAIAKVRSRAEPLDQLTAEVVHLEGVDETLDAWRRTLMLGRGFLLLRGVPVSKWDPNTLKVFMACLGLQFGKLGYQNPAGDLIGEVKDTKADQKDPFARKYATAAEFRFHCDAADLLGLLCVRPAAEGGQSRVASSVAVYNEIRRRRPDLARRLFDPMKLDLRNEQAAGAPAFAEVAPCAFADSRLRTFYISDYFRSVTRLGLTMQPKDLELIELYDDIAGSPNFGLAFNLEPGDVQILNNHVTLHARSAFVDPSEGPGRLLLRFLASVAK